MERIATGIPGLDEMLREFLKRQYQAGFSTCHNPMMDELHTQCRLTCTRRALYQIGCLRQISPLQHLVQARYTRCYSLHWSPP